MGGDDKCCGFNTDSERVTLIAVITFAYPAFVLSALSLPPLFLLGRLTRTDFTCRATCVLGAALKLINSRLNVSFRRTVAAAIFRRSPGAAGLFYRFSNILLLTSLWAAGVCLARALL